MTQPFNVSGTQLISDQSLFDGGQSQHDTQQGSQSTMAEQDLIVKNQFLEFPFFKRHEDGAVSRIQWCDRLLGAPYQVHCLTRTDFGAEPTAKTQGVIDVN